MFFELLIYKFNRIYFAHDIQIWVTLDKNDEIYQTRESMCVLFERNEV